MIRISSSLILLLVWAVFHGRLFLGELYWGDIGIYFYPLYKVIAEHLHSGRLPAWDPYLSQPIIGNPQAGVFYPTSLLLWLFPIERALSISTALHLLLTGFGMLCLLQRLVGDRWAALLGACAWMGCTALIARAQFPPMLASLCWMPWCAFGVLVCAGERPTKGALIFGAAFAMAILAAHPQAAYLTGIASLLCALLWLKEKKAWSAFVLGTVLAIGLSAIYWLPMALNLPEIARNDLSLAKANRFRADFLQLLNPWLPWLYGHPGAEYRGPGNYWETACFVGLAPGLLAFWAGKKRWALFLFVALCLWISLGRAGGLFSILYYALPGLKYFHDPARFMILAAFFLAILSAYGWTNRPKVAPAWLLWIAFIIPQTIVIWAAIPLQPLGAWQKALATVEPALENPGYSPWKEHISYRRYNNRPNAIAELIETGVPNTPAIYRRKIDEPYEPAPQKAWKDKSRPPHPGFAPSGEFRPPGLTIAAWITLFSLLVALYAWRKA